MKQTFKTYFLFLCVFETFIILFFSVGNKPTKISVLVIFKKYANFL